jgi:ubiquinone/menaquinone biosynthesis C-methylase UbiE
MTHTVTLLKDYLKLIESVFDTQKLINSNTDNDSTADYYEKSYWAYRLIHSNQGSIHMSMNFDGKFNKNGYFEQANIVGTHLDTYHPKAILELASGRGFNSILLGEKNPDKVFKGVDLTPKHVNESNKKSKHLKNVTFERGDFQNLHYESESFDLIFVVESFCHAQDFDKALKESFRVLKKGGQMIIIDGFRKKKISELGPEWKKATQLVEKTMSVTHFIEYDTFIKKATSNGFSIEKEVDYSSSIMPTLKRYEKIANIYYRNKFLTTVFKIFLSEKLLMNSVAGILMPLTVGEQIHGYYQITLKK